MIFHWLSLYLKTRVLMSWLLDLFTFLKLKTSWTYLILQNFHKHSFCKDCVCNVSAWRAVFLIEVETLGHRGIVMKCWFDPKCFKANVGYTGTWKKLAFRVLFHPPELKIIVSKLITMVYLLLGSSEWNWILGRNNLAPLRSHHVNSVLRSVHRTVCSLVNVVSLVFPMWQPNQNSTLRHAWWARPFWGWVNN